MSLISAEELLAVLCRVLHGFRRDIGICELSRRCQIRVEVDFLAIHLEADDIGPRHSSRIKEVVVFHRGSTFLVVLGYVLGHLGCRAFGNGVVPAVRSASRSKRIEHSSALEYL